VDPVWPEDDLFLTYRRGLARDAANTAFLTDALGTRDEVTFARTIADAFSSSAQAARETFARVREYLGSPAGKKVMSGLWEGVKVGATVLSAIANLLGGSPF
jgi:hypothetical protein